MEMEARETIVDQQPQGQGTSFGRTCLNGINSLSGVGILSMPYVLSQGGWGSLSLLLLIATVCVGILSMPYVLSQGGWGSLSLLLLIATVCYYTGLLLQRCMDVNENIRTYPDIAYEAYGNIGRVCLTSVLYLEFYLVAVEFLILEEKITTSRVCQQRRS
ncbi:Amino acid transporter AVT1J [Linum perenne]